MGASKSYALSEQLGTADFRIRPLADKFLYRELVLSPRLLAESWRQEERCVRAGENESQQLHQFIRLVQTCISTRREHSIRSYILLQCHRYTSPRCVRSSRQRTDQTRRSPALSHVEMSGHETLTRNKNKKKNATQYIHRLIY